MVPNQILSFIIDCALGPDVPLPQDQQWNAANSSFLADVHKKLYSRVQVLSAISCVCKRWRQLVDERLEVKLRSEHLFFLWQFKSSLKSYGQMISDLYNQDRQGEALLSRILKNRAAAAETEQQEDDHQPEQCLLLEHFNFQKREATPDHRIQVRFLQKQTLKP